MSFPLGYVMGTGMFTQVEILRCAGGDGTRAAWVFRLDVLNKRVKRISVANLLGVTYTAATAAKRSPFVVQFVSQSRW